MKKKNYLWLLILVTLIFTVVYLSSAVIASRYSKLFYQGKVYYVDNATPRLYEKEGLWTYNQVFKAKKSSMPSVDFADMDKAMVQLYAMDDEDYSNAVLCYKYFVNELISIQECDVESINQKADE